MNETLKRTISGAVYIALLLTSILFSTESFILLFGIFLIITIYEFSNIVNLNKVFSILFGTLLYSIVILISHYNKQTAAYLNQTFQSNISLETNIQQLDLVLLAITLVVSIKCIIFLFYDSVQKVSISSKYLYLLGYITLPFIFIVKISFGTNDYNPKIILGLFVLIWTNDTFAYLVGKSMGKHKLFERVSPKKTIEGFVGGMIFAAFAGFLISKFYIQPNPAFSSKSILIWTIIALIVSIFGTIGDLIESKFKRIAGVKDSGSIMPGHGGILDRLDSVIFVAPIIFLFYQILYYVS
ncbi:phosphatidate cytidylyltransferase [Flavobacterium johnsoniae]|jgi:phosphatidate cytidylyltransferase|uniref:Phosphatidate cytidylyltransferase n=1 Tax=Flavobacterium johnsoniae (strain ATCC 17061 / DSM 2064 / JCM 8514 / BCRC 14874 / CCUG 350202 / NBRC 14942 / NCIMB 11054 / UW101) TaxID=376686 RepID=A5FGP9_FLAJ1|nr:phosphatidate cytidylyltransferase [Flavobacterium johnsoniae]ABQ05625.1 phosphatidate cytidylyltransferase [Flavobacterium johnsoniae UW101]OXG00102.1 phosphatidate cytidylyltransferase [Flavobacterium johnsoniae UW101]WQG82572.1 phosphatidate cytidylyltransferase [Flavobacterium johnsoniae UW101]SHL51910.1 phosphatidate cytidylyltransferase [Flavobacterium johnsoniae]